jgi:hypothetical protein
MKARKRTQPSWIPLAVTATLMAKLAVTAQNWQTVDDFGFALLGDAEAHGVATDGAGGIYVVGTASGHAIVRYTADGGSNWITRDDFVYPLETNNAFNAVTVDNQGTVFVGGSSGGYPDGHWIVRRSTDQGLTWETVDDYWRPFIGPDPGTNGVVFSLCTDGQGRVYGFGPLIETHCPCYNHWWVRGSSIGGTNWDTKLVHFSGYGAITSGTCAGEDVYVFGSTDGEDMADVGLILRSSDQGATWTPVFQGPHDFHHAIAPDSAGNLYSAGNRSSSNSYDWIVRKAPPGGTDWTILDTIPYGGPSGTDQASPSSIAVDAAGNISVAGQLRTRWIISGTNGSIYGANQTWFTRQYSVAADQWSTTDLFSYSTNSASATNTHAIAMGTAIAPDGSTFVVGYGTTESSQHRWVVRKRAADTRSQLQIARGNGSLAVSWPAAATNSVLEWSDSGGVNKVWQLFNGNVTVVNGRKTATLGLTPGARFFRLKNATGN